MNAYAEPLIYYASPGAITDPGMSGHQFETLPSELPDLCRAVRGLVLHYRSDVLSSLPLPSIRFDEVCTRYVSRMLVRLAELDPAPLSVARLPDRRLIGCCRDVATLLCAVMRYRKIPARVRVGFATYLAPDIVVDHWVTEIWDTGARRWVLVDAEQEGLIHPPDGSLVDPSNIPRNHFQVAGYVWEACRSGHDDPSRFGYDVNQTGLWVVRANMLHDLACLNKVELTPWDFWGLGLVPFERQTSDDVDLLDKVAMLIRSADDRFPEMRALYQTDARLNVPSVITSYSMNDEPFAVNLDKQAGCNEDDHLGLAGG